MPVTTNALPSTTVIGELIGFKTFVLNNSSLFASKARKMPLKFPVYKTPFACVIEAKVAPMRLFDHFIVPFLRFLNPNGLKTLVFFFNNQIMTP
jgi:hypothetical protein